MAEHEIELVLRFRTNMGQGDLDDLLSGASEQLFADYRDHVDAETGEPESYSVYIPEGSHWRDITPYPGATRPWPRGSVRSIGWDPSASDLPGGNSLGPGRKETPIP